MQVVNQLTQLVDEKYGLTKNPKKNQTMPKHTKTNKKHGRKCERRFEERKQK